MQDTINKASTLIEALPYLQKYRGKIFVLKYGGHAMQDETLREAFLKDVLILKHIGIHPVIVHGGGPQIEKTLEALGIKSEFVSGLRVTDEKTMEVVEMVLVGKVNGELVNLLNKFGGNAVGLAGTDARMISAKKIAPQSVTDKKGVVTMQDLGLVGDVTSVNPELILNLINQGMFVPVISPVGISPEGQSLNINADTAACEIAKALKAEKLMLLTDVDGVLDQNKKVIAEIRTKDAAKLIDKGVVTGGMIPKIQSALDAIQNGVASVVVINGSVLHAILLEIFTDTGLGTLIRE